MLFPPLPVIIIDSGQNEQRGAGRPGLARLLAVPSIHYAAVSPCSPRVRSCGADCAEKQNRWKKQKAAERRGGKKTERLHVSLPPINLDAAEEEEDVQDEKMLLNWDRASRRRGDIWLRQRGVVSTFTTPFFLI